MSEVDDLKKALNTAMSRIAALESRPAQAPGIDWNAFVQDPHGAMTKAGVPVQHVSQVLFAHAMGDKAPPEWRALAAMGPQVSAQQSLASDLGQLRQRLEAFEARDQKAAVKSGFSTLAADKAKYPTLAAAYARNPSLFDSDVDVHKGDAAQLADALEGRLKALAGVVNPQPASTADASKATSQSTQTQQAQGSAVTGGPVDQTPPPLPSGNKPAVFTQNDHQALKERILQKYAKTE